MSSKENNISSLNYLSSKTIEDHKNSFIELNENNEYNLELPSYSSFYMIEDGTEISASFIINSSFIIPFDQLSIDMNNLKNIEQNLVVSEPLIFRGLVVQQVIFTPYTLDYQNNNIIVYEDVEINILEQISQQPRDYTHTKLSKSFEPLFESLIVNYESSDRDEDYQLPSILYICGGSSENHPYVQQLIEWRHKRGYIVNTVSTSETGSSSSSIKNYIENAYSTWEHPPEIVGLIGDTGGSYSIGYFNESWSGYNGAGDMPYSLLEGDDLLPEIFIGRISVNSSTDLNNVINKTLAYEKATYIGATGTEWYETGALCGDPSSSGWSTVITNEYIGNILDSYEFNNVHGNYGNGNYASWMEDELEDGCLYLNYRGYYGSSGFGSNAINSANNGYMNPFAVFITCGTGDFNSTSLSEELFRAGSVSSPKGAVAAIGTATTGTHTLFNNIVNMGIYDGIFPKNLGTAGGAMANGRLSLLWTYPSDPNNWVSIFSHWNSLMGDPGLHLWTDTPKEMQAEFSNNIIWGTNFIDVVISDEDGIAIENASITLLKGDDEIFKTVHTDNMGNATIGLDYNNWGEVFLTVTKQNYIPIETSFVISNSDHMIEVLYNSINIIDDEDEITSGNGDGFLNPGETVIIEVPISNAGIESLYSITGNLQSDSDLITIINGANSYGDLEIEEQSLGTSFYLVHLDGNFTSDTEYEFRLHFTSNQGTLDNSYIVYPTIHAPLVVFDHVELINNIELNPGEESEIRIFLTNSGEYPLNNVQLNLLPSGYLIDIIQDEIFFGDINPGQTLDSNEFARVFINGNTINGSILNVNANVTSEDGYNQSIMFNLNIGHVTQQDPLGPDQHGYYIYDSGDLGYNLAPIYDWIEIDNDFGGDGTELNMSDAGDGNSIANSSVVVDLPFTFTFYGIDYNEITVNTNGWISFGESILESFRNYPIPGAGGPSPMLAAFWDDLKTTNNAEVYVYAGDNYFVVEWSEMKTNFNNSVETFQVILYDDTYLTPTGDNEIKIQYKEFNNTSSGSYSGWGSLHGGYSTIGIENHMSDIGLQYTFNNQYPQASMPLSDQTALLVTTRNPVETLIGDANQDSEINVIDIIVIVNHIINIELLSPIGVYVSDMDGNGILNILDIILIINVILED